MENEQNREKSVKLGKVRRRRWRKVDDLFEGFFLVGAGAAQQHPVQFGQFGQQTSTGTCQRVDQRVEIKTSCQKKNKEKR